MQPSGSEGGGFTQTLSCRVSLHLSLHRWLTFQVGLPPLSLFWPPDQNLETPLPSGAEPLYSLSHPDSSLWHSGMTPNPGCLSNFSRKGMCGTGIAAIFILFLLCSPFDQVEREMVTHRFLHLSRRIKFESHVHTHFVVTSLPSPLIGILL